MATKKSSSREELVLHLDWEYVDACNGFTFDMGGSVMKVAYISKDDWVEPSKRKQGSKGCIRLVNFSREELDEAIQFISTRVKLTKDPSTGIVDIYSTGYGGIQYADRFKNELKASNTSLTEFDCFVQAFMHLVKHVPRKDVLYPASKRSHTAITTEMEQLTKQGKIMRDSGETGLYEGMEERLDVPINFPDPENTDPTKPMTENKDLFPCVVMMLGSGFAGFVVQKDGTFNYIDSSVRGGRMFLGLGSILGGGKNYPELMKLSEKGDISKVTVTTKSIQAQMMEASGSKSEKNDMYSQFMDDNNIYDQPVFTFGHAVGKTADDFKKEDMIRAVLHASVTDTVHVAHSAARFAGAKHVFFAGGFVNNSLVREMFTVEWLRRDGLVFALSPGKQHHIKAHYLIHAQSLGAIGALINHKMQWHEKQKARLLAKAAKGAKQDIKSTVGL